MSADDVVELIMTAFRCIVQDKEAGHGDGDDAEAEVMDMIVGTAHYLSLSRAAGNFPAPASAAAALLVNVAKRCVNYISAERASGRVGNDAAPVLAMDLLQRVLEHIEASGCLGTTHRVPEDAQARAESSESDHEYEYEYGDSWMDDIGVGHAEVNDDVAAVEGFVSVEEEEAGDQGEAAEDGNVGSGVEEEEAGDQGEAAEDENVDSDVDDRVESLRDFSVRVMREVCGSSILLLRLNLRKTEHVSRTGPTPKSLYFNIPCNYVWGIADFTETQDAQLVFSDAGKWCRLQDVAAYQGAKLCKSGFTWMQGAGSRMRDFGSVLEGTGFPDAKSTATLEVVVANLGSQEKHRCLERMIRVESQKTDLRVLWDAGHTQYPRLHNPQSEFRELLLGHVEPDRNRIYDACKVATLHFARLEGLSVLMDDAADEKMQEIERRVEAERVRRQHQKRLRLHQKNLRRKAALRLATSQRRQALFEAAAAEIDEDEGLDDTMKAEAWLRLAIRTEQRERGRQRVIRFRRRNAEFAIVETMRDGSREMAEALLMLDDTYEILSARDDYS